MQIVNTIIYLIGFPGVGKYTIAKEIKNFEQSFKIVDNHLILNPIFSVITLDGITPIAKGVWDNARSIRNIVLDTIENFSDTHTNFIFTNFLGDTSLDHELYDEVYQLSLKRDAQFFPIKLSISQAEHEQRIVQPDRELRFKEINSEAPRKYAEERSLIHISHPNLLELDITNMAAVDAAKTIIKHIKNIKP